MNHADWLQGQFVIPSYLQKIKLKLEHDSPKNKKILLNNSIVQYVFIAY